MNNIVWKSEFSVGVKKLDDQHEQIINLINKLNENIDIAPNSETIHSILNKMMKYTHNHLEYEEDLLKEHHYPDFDDHYQKHQEFLESLGEFSIDTMDNKESVPRELLDFLSSWFSEHILEEDMKFKSFF